MTDNPTPDRKFLTVPEAAEILRVDPVTIYRAIHDDAFPAVKVRGRYLVPAIAIETLAQEAASTLCCVDIADYVIQRRTKGPQ